MWFVAFWVFQVDLSMRRIKIPAENTCLPEDINLLQYSKVRRKTKLIV
jgi:hypothetical protein